MKYKVYDRKGEFLGIINGKNEQDALKEAKAFDMYGAYRVEKIEQQPQGKVIKFKKDILFN